MAHTTEIMVNGILTQVTEFDHSAQEIDDTVDVLGGAKTPQEALANLGAGVRPNLHDNWFFPSGGGFPISQKGGTSLDRWGEVGASVSLLNKGVKLTSTGLDSYLAQYTENPQLYAGETLTLSAIVRDISGEAYVQLYAYNGSTFTTVPSSKATSDDIVSTEVTIPTDTVAIFSRLYVSEGGAATFVASKLEEGKGQTLGYKKPDGSVAMLPQSGKKLAQMLAECQRYQLALWRYFISPAVHFQPNYIDFSIPVPVELRTTPVLNQSDFVVYADTKGSQSDFVLSVVGISSNAIRVRATKEGHGLTLADGVRIEVNVERAILDANL